MIEKIPTIFDTDPGIDDAFALSFLNKSEIFDVKMISSVAGNVKLEHTTRNLQGLAFAMDWQVPIYKGLAKPILGPQVLAEGFHGENGLLGYEFADNELKKLEDKSQITLIVQSIIVVILFFTCEALLFTYLSKPVFYIIGVICLLLTLGLCNVFKFNLFSFKALKRNEVALIIISFLVLEITTYLLTTFFPMPNNQEGLNNVVDQSNLIIAIITLGILIPIIEECVCRGVLIKVLFQKKQRIGVIISILLFTFAHGPTSITDFIIYGLPAVIYSVIYYKTKRLEIPIIIHIMNNLYVFLP